MTTENWIKFVFPSKYVNYYLQRDPEVLVLANHELAIDLGRWLEGALHKRVLIP